MGQGTGDEDALEGLRQNAVDVANSAGKESVDLGLQGAFPIRGIGGGGNFSQFRRQIVLPRSIAPDHHGEPMAKFSSWRTLPLKSRAQRYLTAASDSRLVSTPQFPGALLKEVPGQQRDVFPALPQMSAGGIV